MFDREKLASGLVILSIGVVFMAKNLGYIDFHLGNVLKLWPILIIVAGVNLLLPKNSFGNMISILTVLASIGTVVYFGTGPKEDASFHFSWRDSRTMSNGAKASASKSKDETTYFKEYFSQEYLPTYEKATLKISGGAITYEIVPSAEDKLFKAQSESTISSHTMKFSENGNEAKIDFAMKSTERTSLSMVEETSRASMELHKNPVWDIDLNIGAGKADFNLVENKIEKLSIECGAAAIEAKLGYPQATTKIDVESGAGSVKLMLPIDAPAKIYVKTGLSSRNFDGFDKIDNGEYVTSNFDSSKEHFEIHLKGGLSSFKVVRY